MSDLMHEVNEDLRRQQLEQFWRENRLWILGGILLAIVTTGGMAAWRSYDYKKDMTATTQLMEASATGDIAGLEAFAAQHSAGHGVLARFTAANVLLQRGEKEKALEALRAIENSRADRIFRDLATLYIIQQRLATDDPDKLRRELKPLLDSKNPWRFSAMEMEALLLAREGRMKEAADKLSYISGDAEAPQDVRTRAFTLRELYAGEAGTAAPEKAPAAQDTEKK